MDNKKNIGTSEVSSMPAETGDCITEVQNDSCSQKKTALEIQEWLVSYVAEILEIETKEIDITIPLERYGLDSSEAVVLSGDLQDWLECDLDPELLLDYQTIEALTQYLIEEEIPTSNTSSPQKQNKPKILPQKVNMAGNHALSQGQKALWFLYKLAPESHAYNVAFTARICSQVNVSALKQTFQQLNDRHPMLRAIFFEQDGEPLQTIHDRQEICFEEFDASAWSPDELKQQVITAYQRPFDLEQGPILRVSLFNCSECDRVLLLSIHHIACDGWSIWLLLDELRVIYQGQIHQFESLLPTLEFSYLDYVRWQSEILASSEGEKLWHYWQQQLAGELPMLNLPTDRPRPPIQTYRGDSHTFKLSKELTQKLKELGQNEGATLYMTLLAAFQVLLHRYTSQDDILVGSPLKCRIQSEWSRVFGYLVNPVVLRANLAGNPSFQSFLAQIRQTVLGAIAHQDYPFPLLVERLQPERESSRSPLFQTMFVLQKPNKSGDILDLLAADETISRVNWGGLELESFEIPQQDGQFDLTLEMIETKDSIRGIFKYDTDLFDAATIARMEGHFEVLLEGIVANPQQSIGNLPILTSSEEHQLLVEWNDTKADYPQDKCIHQLFEEQVVKTPDAIAVVFEDQQLTYGELNSRANQLAHYLKSLGVKPEVLVGICVERSLEMVVGLLGILKAGGAYVPIDPAYPTERIAYMLNDSQVKVLLTQEKLVVKLPEHKAQLLFLDKVGEIISQESKKNPFSETKPDNLVYVIYTSGSTGQPKGVIIQHQSLVNFTKSTVVEFNLSHCDRILQFASISFDTTAEEIYPCLSSGGMLVLRTDEMLSSISTFLEQCNNLQLTIIDLPTAFWQYMTDEIAKDKIVLPNNLRLVIIGGEKASPESVRIWQDCVGDFPQLANTYGPTEGTVVSTVYKPTKSSSLYREVPIGKAIANVTLYILDYNLQPVPIGVPGELHIGGVGLARGYLNRPEITAEKFITSPFSQEEEVRLYKTCDLSRYLSDGNIEYLGRIDHQVKIRGFRIELGEIESVLAQHSQVRETVVIAKEHQSGSKQLVAYVVAHQNSLVTNDLRKYLKEKLPEYMIPSAFVLLEALPLTPNGKVDRRALPAPDHADRTIESSFVAPRTSTEEILATIWAEVLGLEQVGVYDNFFEMGGDSILSLQVVARANQVDLKLTPQQLFQHQTIAELANVAITIREVKAEQSLVMGSVPLTPIQSWFFEHNPPEPHHFNQSVLLKVDSNIKPELLEQVIKQLLEHHDALRLRFVSTENIWKQTIEEIGEIIPFQTIDLSRLSAQEHTVAIEARARELQASLNLSEGTIMQVALFKLGSEQPGRLLIIIHHLAVDGVSWRILLEDFAIVYQQISQEKAVQLPSKTTSFKYWSQRLQEYGQSEERIADLNYWLSQSEVDIVPLPTDYPSEVADDIVENVAVVSVSLNKEQTRALLQEVPSVYNTQINDVLLTALLQTFAQWTGESLLLVDLEGHGREELFEEVDLSRTIGWFTSVFPVLLRLEESDYPWEILKSVKEQLRRIPKRGIGYGILRYLSQEEQTHEQLKTLLQAQVSFNYLGQFESMLSASPLLGLAPESKGQEQSILGKRRYLLEVNGLVTSGNLQLDWTYSRKIHQRATVEQLAQQFVEVLQTLIIHCQSPNAGGYTPSDFPESELSQEELDELIAEIY